MTLDKRGGQAVSENDVTRTASGEGACLQRPALPAIPEPESFGARPLFGRKNVTNSAHKLNRRSFSRVCGRLEERLPSLAA